MILSFIIVKIDKKSFRELWLRVKKVVKRADVVIEVVDARNPFGTRSRELERLASKLGKPLIIVINKADLVPKDVLDEWKRVLSKEYETVYISAKERLGTRRLWTAIKKVTKKKPVTIAVTGYPNVGKSTIINLLKGRHSAGTSPIPGYTKHAQIIRAATWLKVVDTPGIIPLKGSESELVFKGALSPESLGDPLPTALKLIEKILAKDETIFAKTYGVKARDPMAVLEEFAEKRKLYAKGGKLNLEEAARIIIRDWQRGKLVVYYTPQDYRL